MPPCAIAREQRYPVERFLLARPPHAACALRKSPPDETPVRAAHSIAAPVSMRTGW